MLTSNEVLALLNDLESDRTERTASTTNTDKFGEAICAFSNDFPQHQVSGYLLIGVRDNGELSSLTVTDQMLQNLGAMRSDGNIQPLPAISVSKHSFPGGDVIVVEVLPSDLPPVSYRGRVWIRVGPRRALATEFEERILSERRVSLAKTFDARACSESNIKDLSISLFESYRQEAVAPDVIETNHRTIQEQLASLRMVDALTQKPTNAGLILFGKNPRFFLPGAYVQFLSLSGDNLADIPQDQAEISGDLLSMLRELDSRVRSLNRKSLQGISALQEEVVSDYPEVAIRELLMNAIMHRNYDSNTPVRFYWFSDRIEIHSSGGLYGEVNSDNYLNHSSYRNPILAEAMKNYGYVNRFGYGIQRAQRMLSENGNPPAEFEFRPESVLVTIRRGA